MSDRWWEEDMPVAAAAKASPAPLASAGNWWEQDTPVSDLAKPAKAEPTEQPGMLDRIGSFARDLVTGEGRTEFPDMPELSSMTDRPYLGHAVEAKIAGATLLTPDEKAQADIIKTAAPGTETKADKFGNVLVRLPGMKDFAYLNKPGASGQDAAFLASQAVQFIPAGRLAGMGATLAGRTALGGAAAGATSVAQDVLAGEMGSEQGVDFGRAGVAAAGGAAGELVSPAIAALWRRRPWRAGLVDAQGGLSQEGVRWAQAAGVDPSTITPQTAKAMDDLARRYSRGEMEAMLRQSSAAFADDAARAASPAERMVGQAEAQSTGIRTTLGQAAGDIRQQAREEAMRNYGRGRAAGDTMRAFDDAQRGDVARAAETVRTRLTGQDGPLRDPASVAGGVQGAVRDLERAASRQVDDAYQAVRDSDAMSARVSLDNLQALPQRIARSFRETDAVVSSKLTPQTADAIRDLNKLMEGEPGASALTLRRLERYRRELGVRIDAAKAAQNKADAFNLTGMKRDLDAFLDDAFDNSLFEGSPEALGLLKNARQARAEYGAKFETRGRQDDAGKVIEKIIGEDRTNVEVANWLFGSSALGQAGQSVRLAKRLKEVLPEDEWNSVREAALHRLVYGATNQRGENVSLQRAFTDFGEALKGKGRPYMNVLFSQDEMKELETLRRAIGRGITDPAARNPSKTGYEISRLVQDAADKLPILAGLMTGNPVAGVAAAGAGAASRAITNRGAARAATDASRALPRPRVTPLAPALAASAAASTESQRSPNQ